MIKEDVIFYTNVYHGLAEVIFHEHCYLGTLKIYLCWREQILADKLISRFIWLPVLVIKWTKKKLFQLRKIWLKVTKWIWGNGLLRIQRPCFGENISIFLFGRVSSFFKICHKIVKLRLILKNLSCYQKRNCSMHGFTLRKRDVICVLFAAKRSKCLFVMRQKSSHFYW